MNPRYPRSSTIGAARRRADEERSDARSHVGDELLEGIAHLVAREMARGDGAVPVVQSTTASTPALMAPIEGVVAALERAGFERARALAGWAAVVALVNGHVAYQLAGHMTQRSIGDRAIDFDAAFALAIDALVTGLAAQR